MTVRTAISQSIAITTSTLTGSLLIFSTPTIAATIGVDWLSPIGVDINSIRPSTSGIIFDNKLNPRIGNLNGTTLTFMNAGGGIYFRNLSDGDFAAAPLSGLPQVLGRQQVIGVPTHTNWTATFSNPVSDLLLYAHSWRGLPTEDGLTTYTFDQPFTILSGLAGATISGNTLSLPISNHPSIRSNGVLQFTSPLSSLSVTTNANNTNIGQLLTFGIDQEDIPSQPVSEPMTIFGLATVVSFQALFKDKNSKKQHDLL